jgi:hypothetical protein
MEREITQNPVIFRVFKDSGEVIALFPTIPAGGVYIESYQHIGQHGPAQYHEIVPITRLAKAKEYRELKKELEKIGYRNLKICKRNSPKMWNLLWKNLKKMDSCN